MRKLLWWLSPSIWCLCSSVVTLFKDAVHGEIVMVVTFHLMFVPVVTLFKDAVDGEIVLQGSRCPSISVTWVSTSPWWPTPLPDGLRPWEKSPVVWLRCLPIPATQPTWVLVWPLFTSVPAASSAWVTPAVRDPSALWEREDRLFVLLFRVVKMLRVYVQVFR